MNKRIDTFRISQINLLNVKPSLGLIGLLSDISPGPFSLLDILTSHDNIVLFILSKMLNYPKSIRFVRPRNNYDLPRLDLHVLLIKLS